MTIQRGLFGGWKVYANRSEQRIIAEDLGLPQKAVYRGDEAIAILAYAKDEIRSGRGEVTDRWGAAPF